MRPALATVGLALAAAAAGCARSKRYYSHVEVLRVAARRMERGTGLPRMLDVEVRYVDCPGTQTEVIRGGQDFARCFYERNRVGARVGVQIEHHPTRDGEWEWHVLSVGGCARPPDHNDEASFETVQECRDVFAYGQRIGFRCDRIPQRELLARCPWFRRR
ncbi:MAG: hypothetical protein R3A52_27645 [Polyangiales bacterium]